MSFVHAFTARSNASFAVSPRNAKIGVEGANMKRLAVLSKRSPLKLKGLSFDRMFRWVTGSLIRTTQTKLGDRVSLTNPVADGWAEV